MSMNAKIILTVIVLAILAGVYWFMSAGQEEPARELQMGQSQQPSSSTAQSAGSGRMGGIADLASAGESKAGTQDIIVTGGPLKAGSDPIMGLGTNQVRVTVDGNTKITKKVSTQTGKPFEGEFKQEVQTATMADLVLAIGKGGLLVAVESATDIRSEDGFTATAIEYSTLVTKP